MKWLITLLLLFLLLSPHKALTVECEGAPPSSENEQELSEFVKKCEEKVSTLSKEKATLSQAVAAINSKISLTQGQISQTEVQIKAVEKEIAILGGILDKVNQSTSALSKIYLARVQESYRRIRVNKENLLFTTSDFSDYFSKLKYLNTLKSKDQLILNELEKSRQDYDSRRQSELEKQKEIEALKKRMEVQRSQLSVQQQEKQNLLIITANDEKKYSQLLEKARAELEAIESIIAGKGSETEVKDVSAGDKIATVISGASACSSGTHLHFEVVNSRVHQSPASFLKNMEVIWNNDPDGSFSFTGSWDWPLNEKVRITQGYGHTSYSSRYANDKHTGIDMVSTDSLDVKAVRKGKLYRGSIACGKGTLKYVRVKHSEDSYDTFYLHVNYF